MLPRDQISRASVAAESAGSERLMWPSSSPSTAYVFHSEPSRPSGPNFCICSLPMPRPKFDSSLATAARAQTPFSPSS